LVDAATRFVYTIDNGFDIMAYSYLYDSEYCGYIGFDDTIINCGSTVKEPLE